MKINSENIHSQGNPCTLKLDISESRKDFGLRVEWISREKFEVKDGIKYEEAHKNV